MGQVWVQERILPWGKLRQTLLYLFLVVDSSYFFIRDGVVGDSHYGRPGTIEGENLALHSLSDPVK